MIQGTPLSKEKIKELEDDHSKVLNDILSNYQRVEYEYWGALLTLEGFLLAVFSFFGFQNSPTHQIISIIIPFGIIICLISSILLIANFYSRVRTFQDHLKLFSPLREKIITEEQLIQFGREMNAYLPKEAKEYESRRKRTFATLCLLGIQAIIVILILFVMTGLYQEIVRFFCIVNFLLCR